MPASRRRPGPGRRASRVCGLGSIVTRSEASRGSSAAADLPNTRRAPASTPNWPRTPFDHVEINFENPPFSQGEVEPDGQRRFDYLAHVAAGGPQKQVFDGLLGDAGATSGKAQVVRLLKRLDNAAKIDPMVLAITRVFRDDERPNERGGNRVQWNPNSLHRLSSHTTPQHHGGDGRNDAIGQRQPERHQQHQDERQTDETDNAPDAAPPFHCYHPQI